MRLSGILLAAGLSRRMGRDKLCLLYGGLTLLDRALALLTELPLDERIVVATPARLSAVRLSADVVAVANPHPERGQSESLRLGVAAAGGDAYLFLSADAPRLTVGVLAPLLALWRQNPEKIVSPAVGGIPVMPSIFPARFRAELLSATGDRGGRAVRAAHPGDCLSFEAADPVRFADIDTAEDYRRLVEEAPRAGASL